MEEYGLPERLFATGYEPSGRKRINNYFNLRWIDVINHCISDAHQEMMAESQFRQILQMGQHTFSVMFVHQLLCRQLVTAKLYELWWTFAGKPIRYGIGEFALVTGLECGKASTSSLGTSLGGHPKKKGKSKGKAAVGTGAVWKALFGSEDKITPEWILSRLALGEKYKDADTRFKLALLLLVEGILCPTSGTTSVRPEVVELVGDIEAFLKYPWGRESFLLTVNSVKAKTPAQYAADTTAIQGFAHAIVLVTVCSCPKIISDPASEADLDDEGLSLEEVVAAVCASSLKINVVTTKTLEVIGQAQLRSILCPEHGIELFEDEVTDVSVTQMISLIEEDFPFETNTWRGGVKANDARNQKSPVEDGLEGQDLPGGSTNVHPRPPNTVPLPSVGGGLTELELRRIIRHATDDVEGRLEAMLGGYFTSIQGYMADEFRKLNEVGRYGGPFKTRQPERGGNGDGCTQTGLSKPTGTFGDSRGDNEGDECIGETQLERSASPRNDGTRGTPTRANVSVPRGSGPEVQGGPPPEQVPLGGEDGVENGGSDPGQPQSEAGSFVEESGSRGHRIHDIQSNVVNISSTGNTQDLGAGEGTSIAENTKAGGSFGERGGSPPRRDPDLGDRGVSKHSSGGNIEIERGELVTETNVVPVRDVVVQSLRASRRIRTLTDRYTPPGPDPKKLKRKVESKAKAAEKIVEMDSEIHLSVTEDPIGPLLSGFSPFVGVNAFRVAAFKKTISTEMTCNGGEGSTISNAVFKDVFDSSRPLNCVAADVVVNFVRHRLEVAGKPRVSFLPASFLSSVMAEFKENSHIEDKTQWTFTNIMGVELKALGTWCVDVDLIYCPFQLEGRHWVGIVIDLQQWSMRILDCNIACASDAKLESNLAPLSIMLPLLIGRFGGPPASPDFVSFPMKISRLDLQLLCEITGLSCVASVILLELHAMGKLHLCEHITEGCIRIGAQKYAVEAFATFNPDLLAP